MATTFSAIGEAGARNNGRYLGLALPVIAAAQMMVVLDDAIGAGCADDGCLPARAGSRL